ncbi:hypothetical protein AMELA_G00270090 [Ameiurus melas]|uniref:Uncharacterized protein n=1 Tax=Ameiurus melas TaxID=219545 RepID=A0A7J5ZNM8_AMEME|nr:hypothetical protein AMELA_G00270090 [Ameiurus melas]
MLYQCRITDRGCAALTAALKLNSSHLKELDLSGNELGNSVTQLEELLKRLGGQIRYDEIHMSEMVLHSSSRHTREEAPCTVM